MAASAALGGTVGALIGSFAGGVGAIPGAAAGAAAGAELGMLLLNALGIGFLAVYIVQHITKVFDLATQGVKEDFSGLVRDCFGGTRMVSLENVFYWDGSKIYKMEDHSMAIH